MELARVIGRATSTVKHRSLDGWKMLIVQPLGINQQANGEPFIAIDGLGSGLGEVVILTSDGAHVRDMMKTDATPVRWAILGIADEKV